MPNAVEVEAVIENVLKKGLEREIGWHSPKTLCLPKNCVLRYSGPTVISSLESRLNLQLDFDL
jgi:hypothetical protein